MKKNALSLAVGSALLLAGATTANAAFIESDTGLTGDVLIEDFADLNNTWTLTLSNLSGDLRFQDEGCTDCNTTAFGTLLLDLVDGQPLPGQTQDAEIDFTSRPVFDGDFDVDYTGVGSVGTGVFGGASFTGTLSVGDTVSIDYDGSTPLFNDTLGFDLGDIAGSLTATITSLDATSVALSVSETPGVWSNGMVSSFEGVANALDQLVGGGDGTIDTSDATPGTTGDGLVIAADSGVQAIPAPATLLLLGMGLMGIGAARRRKAA